MFRMMPLIPFALIGGIGIWWLLREYIFPAQKQQGELKAANLSALKKAEVDYLEIRKYWIGFYSLNRNREYYADAMDDIKIPQVAAFQRMMVAMNNDYGNLQNGKILDETFIGKTTALRTLFEEAVTEAKRNSLT